MKQIRLGVKSMMILLKNHGMKLKSGKDKALSKAFYSDSTIQMLNMMRSTYSHSFDPYERGNCINLIHHNIDHFVYLENEKCTEIFKKLRAWLLNLTPKNQPLC